MKCLLIAIWIAGHLPVFAQTKPERMLNDFKYVTIKGNFSVQLKKADRNGMELSGGLTEQDITSTVSDDTLFITAAGQNGSGMLTLFYKQLQSLRTEGLASLSSDQAIEQPNFKLTSLDNRNVSLSFRTQALHIVLGGAGNHQFAGKTSSLQLALDGSGFADALKLTCSSSNVSLKGPGKIHFYPGENFIGAVHGDGELAWQRPPKNQVLSGDVRGVKILNK